MNNERELVHATMQWHLLHANRMALNKQRLALEKEIWPKTGRPLGYQHPDWRRLQQIKAQIVALKQKERTALRGLAKVCAAQRSVYGAAEVVDFSDDALTLEMAE